MTLQKNSDLLHALATSPRVLMLCTLDEEWHDFGHRKDVVELSYKFANFLSDLVQIVTSLVDQSWRENANLLVADSVFAKEIWSTSNEPQIILRPRY